jgi:hypothetical protein
VIDVRDDREVADIPCRRSHCGIRVWRWCIVPPDS